jgi:hypothetical protein
LATAKPYNRKEKHSKTLVTVKQMTQRNLRYSQEEITTTQINLRPSLEDSQANDSVQTDTLARKMTRSKLRPLQKTAKQMTQGKVRPSQEERAATQSTLRHLQEDSQANDPGNLRPPQEERKTTQRPLQQLRKQLR